MLKKSKIVYIDANDFEKPCVPLRHVLRDATEGALGDISYYTTARKRKSSTKVRITVTIEVVK